MCILNELQDVHDLPETLGNCESNMYADDTKIDHPIKQCDSHILESELNNDMGEIKGYRHIEWTFVEMLPNVSSYWLELTNDLRSTKLSQMSTYYHWN